MLKRMLSVAAIAVVVSACCSNEKEIKINELNPEADAVELSVNAVDVIEAQSYEEFVVARQRLEQYEAAFRTQVGGDAYVIFLEECNYILNE